MLMSVYVPINQIIWQRPSSRQQLVTINIMPQLYCVPDSTIIIVLGITTCNCIVSLMYILLYIVLCTKSNDSTGDGW